MSDQWKIGRADNHGRAGKGVPLNQRWPRIFLIKPSLPDSPLSTESVVRSRGSGRRTAPRHTPADLQKHEFPTHLNYTIKSQRFGSTYERELLILTAGVGPEEPEVVLSPQLGGQREPVALLHLRHLHLRLAQDGRLVILAADMDIEIS